MDNRIKLLIAILVFIAFCNYLVYRQIKKEFDNQRIIISTMMISQSQYNYDLKQLMQIANNLNIASDKISQQSSAHLSSQQPSTQSSSQQPPTQLDSQTDNQLLPSQPNLTLVPQNENEQHIVFPTPPSFNTNQQLEQPRILPNDDMMHTQDITSTTDIYLTAKSMLVDFALWDTIVNVIGIIIIVSIVFVVLSYLKP